MPLQRPGCDVGVTGDARALHPRYGATCMADSTILFADLAGFSALTEAHGDLDAVAIADRFEAMARDALEDGAALVKMIGDAAMIVADTPASGIRTALALRRLVHSEPHFPALRGGLHTGPTVERGGDHFGATVNLTARVAAEARSGQLLGTQIVADHASKLTGVVVREVGVAQLKNLTDPVALFDLEDAESDDVLLAVDPVCRMRVDPDLAPARLPFAGHTWYFCCFDCARAFAARPQQYASS